MPSLSKMANHLGITEARVCQLKKLGLPMSSFAAADRWREQRVRRAPTNRKEEALKEEKALRKGIKIKKPSNTGDSLLDALRNAISVADGAFEDYELARKAASPSRSMRLSEHNKALDARLKAEVAFRTEQERRNILVPKAEVMDRARRIVDNVLRRVRKLPQEQGPQCNPGDPLIATKVLERAIDEILVACQSALKEAAE